MEPENYMVLPHESDGNYFGGSDAEQEVCHCDSCSLPKFSNEMSKVDGICLDCYDRAVQKLGDYAGSQDDYALQSVFDHLTGGSE
jgi:hypothetical protein